MTYIDAKPSFEGVEKAILNSAKAPRDKSLIYLRDEMNNFGYNFPQNRKGEKMAYKVAEEIWWNIREQKQPLSEFPITELSDLPATRVRFGGKDYFLHGIVHWSNGDLAKPVKDFIHEKAIEYETKDRSKLFLEPGFKEVFLDNHQDKTFNFRGCLDSITLPPLMNLASHLNPKYRDTIETWKQVRNDINCTPKAKELIARTQLPEPLYMDSIRDDKSKRRVGTDFSEQMMHDMLTNDDNVDEVHALIGVSHEPQIEYLLNHTDEETAKKIIICREFYNFVKEHR